MNKSTLQCALILFSSLSLPAFAQYSEQFNSLNTSDSFVGQRISKSSDGSPKYSYTYEQGACRGGNCCTQSIKGVRSVSNKVIYIPPQKACNIDLGPYYACSISSYWRDIAQANKPFRIYRCTSRGWAKAEDLHINY